MREQILHFTEQIRLAGARFREKLRSQSRRLLERGVIQLFDTLPAMPLHTAAVAGEKL